MTRSRSIRCPLCPGEFNRSVQHQLQSIGCHCSEAQSTPAKDLGLRNPSLREISAMSRSVGNCCFSQPEICCGDHCTAQASAPRAIVTPHGATVAAGRWCSRCCHAAMDCADHRSKPAGVPDNKLDEVPNASGWRLGRSNSAILPRESRGKKRQ
jgi:hypothetical protein